MLSSSHSTTLAGSTVTALYIPTTRTLLNLAEPSTDNLIMYPKIWKQQKWN